MRKKLLRFLRLAPLALLFASAALAQTTSTILGVVTDASTGKPVEGAVVIATSPNLQGEQTAVTAADGSFRITLLPAGQYKLLVQVAGFRPGERSGLRLSIDKTLRANVAVVPEAVTLEEQVVRTGGAAPIINVGSAESGSVVSRDFIDSLPVGRSYQAISATVPQAAGDSYGVGFAGGQSPENGYIVDGLNVTDPVYGAAPGTWSGRSAPTLLSDFVQEVDVKTGSFMPEYGRSTGGIVNVVTNSGSNEFHGSIFSNLRPDWLVTPNGKTIGNDGEAVAYFSNPNQGSYNLDFGAKLGGPILKDKLWFSFGVAPILTKTYYDRFQRLNVTTADQPGCTTSSSGDTLNRCRDGNGQALWNKVPGSDQKVNSKQSSTQFNGKLTYLLNSDNTVSLATYGQPSTLTTHGFNRPQDANANFDTAIDSYDVVGHYAGKFLQKRLLVEADVGWHGQRIKDKPNDYQSNRGAVVWTDPTSAATANSYSLTAFENVAGCTDLAHCPVSGYRTGGYGFTANQKIDRYAGKLSVGGLFSALGQHQAKVGIDLERNDYDQTKRYSGGYLFTARGGAFRARRGYGYLANGVSTQNILDVTPTGSLSTKSFSDSNSYYLQDSWQVLGSGLTVNYGLRLETQKLENRENHVDKFNITDSYAPRVQAIWDFTGNGRGKISANWGRFYWAVPLDMGDRAFGNEREINFRESFSSFGLPTGGGVASGSRYNPGSLAYAGFDPIRLVDQTTGLPTFPNVTTSRFTQTGASSTPVQPGLKAPYVDMFGGAAEFELLADLSVGVEYSGKRQGIIIEDMSPDDGNQYFIANPGENKSWTFCAVPNDPTSCAPFSARNATAVDSATGRSINVTFPKPVRSYDGITFKVAKNYSRNWMAQASYTYSVLRGNYQGPFMSDYGGAGQGQLDPGITAAYDLPSLVYNTQGLLPGDHTHSVKLFGAYTWVLGPRFSVTAGAGYTGLSGRPMNALGAHEVYGLGLGYIIQQGSAGRTPFTNQVDLKGALSYVIRAPYQVKFSVDVFNILNEQAIQLYDQNYTFDTVQPIQAVKCKPSAVGSSDPIGALKAACPDIAFLKTIEGRPATPNLNWGKPLASTLAYQTPIQLRLGLALSF